MYSSYGNNASINCIINIFHIDSLPLLNCLSRATVRHLLTFSVGGGGGGWAFVYPGKAPGYLTLVFESAMDEFIGKDEAFVEQWLVRQGLKKLDLNFVHHKTITDVNTTISHFAFKTSL